MKYLEETTNNILRSLIMEVADDTAKGGGAGGGGGGGDGGPFPLDPYASDPYYDPSAREIDWNDPEYFWEHYWEKYGQDYPVWDGEETQQEYEDRVRDFYRELWEQYGDDPQSPIHNIFPHGNQGRIVWDEDLGIYVPESTWEGSPHNYGPEGIHPTWGPEVLVGGPLIRPAGKFIGQMLRDPWTYGEIGAGYGWDYLPDWLTNPEPKPHQWHIPFLDPGY